MVYEIAPVYASKICEKTKRKITIVLVIVGLVQVYNDV